MPRPAAGVSGKGMPGRRHRTADRQPGAGNSHIGLYVRRDAEASQVTVPAPLLRQGFLREGSGTPERMPESGRPGACSQSISRPAGLRRVALTASTRSGGRLFLSGCSRGAQKTTAESHRPSEGHPHWPGHRKKAFSPDTGRAGRKGTIRPAGETLRPIRQICARKGEKQPEGRRMRFSLYRFVL